MDELLSDYLHAFASQVEPPQRGVVHSHWLRRYGREGRLMTSTCSGCESCGGSGFKGRIGIHELMAMSKDLRRLVQGRAPAEVILGAAQAGGMHTLRQDGIEKVLLGLTTIGEVRATSNA